MVRFQMTYFEIADFELVYFKIAYFEMAYFGMAYSEVAYFLVSKNKKGCYHDWLKPPFLFPLGSCGNLTTSCKYWIERTSLSFRFFFLYNFFSQRYTISDERKRVSDFVGKRGDFFFPSFFVFLRALKQNEYQIKSLFYCSPYRTHEFSEDSSGVKNPTFGSRFLLLVYFSPLHSILPI